MKLSNEKISILESTGAQGVTITSMEDFIKENWSLSYKRIVYRELKINRNRDFINSLESLIKVNFKKQVVGKGYAINPFRLFQKYSSNDSPSNLKENSSFFCSELIASIYKRLGLLQNEISSSQYWPGTLISVF